MRLAHRYNPVAKSKMGEVEHMWKKRMLKAICFLAVMALVMHLLTINAC